ncbi:hypothetical protein GCM10023336_41930 [Streptomyces similanensis]|uniref:Uncharacterized protein n=1 Tax=Streptomyces similanensis TaxID=1274988 RepID=A0ABP9KP91_9ACTN
MTGADVLPIADDRRWRTVPWDSRSKLGSGAVRLVGPGVRGNRPRPDHPRVRQGRTGSPARPWRLVQFTVKE